MCGIQLHVYKDNTPCSGCSCEFLGMEDINLRNRGPDSCLCIEKSTQYYNIRLQASVLQMRQDLVTQPIRIKEDVYLCWNGEVYETQNDPNVWNHETSDTRLVANELEIIFAQEEEDNATIRRKISEVMATFHNAEFSFLILTKTSVFFGRDKWGRRSLLRRDCPGGCGSFEIVSTTEILSVTEKSDEAEERQSWIEILPGMVHQTSLIENPSTHNTSYPFISFTSPRPREFEDASISKSKPEEVSKELWDSSTELEFHLRRAVAMRLDQNGPSAVLFSGGLDSAVVAALAAELCTHPLYLYNVSFGPSFMKSADRKAALITAELLQQKYPDKKIIYRDIIVDWEDISKHEPHIRTLLQPKTTLMDVNIGIALWFAGRGKVDTESEDGIACDPNRVLLLGMGADEQMGGYGRHRKAFDRGGWESLGEELEMDQSRFWERNLGRDDRICADHSKEARFPFLDAHVVRFLKKLPLSQICDFSLPPGEGDKRILRLVAARIGLDHASGLVKRAIQFGSRISHLSDAKRFGSRRKAKGQASVNAG